METVHTTNAPPAAGHYSQAIVHNGIIYVSGQLGLDPSGNLVSGGIEAQTEQTLRNVEAILKAAGSGLEHVLSMTVYITEQSLWPQVNETYARVMGVNRPARAIISVKELRAGCYIEIQATAATPA